MDRMIRAGVSQWSAMDRNGTARNLTGGPSKMNEIGSREELLARSSLRLPTGARLRSEIHYHSNHRQKPNSNGKGRATKREESSSGSSSTGLPLISNVTLVGECSHLGWSRAAS